MKLSRRSLLALIPAALLPKPKAVAAPFTAHVVDNFAPRSVKWIIDPTMRKNEVLLFNPRAFDYASNTYADVIANTPPFPDDVAK